MLVWPQVCTWIISHRQLSNHTPGRVGIGQCQEGTGLLKQGQILQLKTKQNKTILGAKEGYIENETNSQNARLPSPLKHILLLVCLVPFLSPHAMETQLHQWWSADISLLWKLFPSPGKYWSRQQLPQEILQWGVCRLQVSEEGCHAVEEKTTT